jgi:hypothetical protein
MVNHLLVNIVNSVLGVGKATARGNQAYHCPFCHHTKPNSKLTSMIWLRVILGIVGFVTKKAPT